MKHETAREWMQLALDGTLGAEADARLQDHLRGCPACAAEMARLEGLHARLARVLPAERPARSFTPAEIDARLEDVLSRTRRIPMNERLAFLPRLLAGAAALALLLFGAVWMYRNALIPNPQPGAEGTSAPGQPTEQSVNEPVGFPVLAMSEYPGLLEQPLAWSPDGKWLAFFSPEMGLMLQPGDGGAPQAVLEIPIGENLPYAIAWSPQSDAVLAYLPYGVPEQPVRAWLVEVGPNGPAPAQPLPVDSDAFRPLGDPYFLDQLWGSWKSDGRQIVFAAGPVLWIWDRNGGGNTLLANLVDAQIFNDQGILYDTIEKAFWSPDLQHIALDLSSSTCPNRCRGTAEFDLEEERAVQLLVDGVAAAGWMPQGQAIYGFALVTVGNVSKGGAYLVHADGSVESLSGGIEAHPDAAGQVEVVQNLAWNSLGQYFYNLIDVRYAEPVVGLYAFDSASNPIAALASEDGRVPMSPAWVQADRLAYLEARRVNTDPLGAWQLLSANVGGEPVTLDLPRDALFYAAAWSPDGRKLALYMVRSLDDLANGPSLLVVSPVTAGGEALANAPTPEPFVTQPTEAPVAVTPPPAVAEPAYVPQILLHTLGWAPDGRSFAYLYDDWALEVSRPDGSEARVLQVESRRASAGEIAWSPQSDGLVVYDPTEFMDTARSSRLDLTDRASMYYVPIGADGLIAGDPRPLPFPPIPEGVDPSRQTQPIWIAFSEDGQWLVFNFMGDAYRMSLTSREPERLTDLRANPLTLPGANRYDRVTRVLAADGDQIALGLTGTDCPSPCQGVGLWDAATGESRLLLDMAALDGLLPNGELLVRNVTGDWTEDYTYDCYALNPADGGLVNLTASNPQFDPLIDGYDNSIANAERRQVVQCQAGPLGAVTAWVANYALPQVDEYWPGNGMVYVSPDRTEVRWLMGEPRQLVLGRALLDGRFGALLLGGGGTQAYRDVYGLQSVQTDQVYDMRPAERPAAPIFAAQLSPDGRYVSAVTPLEDGGGPVNVLVFPVE